MINDRNVLLANKYKWADTADILYYIAAVIDQLGVSIGKYVLCGSHTNEGFKLRMTHEFDLSDEMIELREHPGKRLLDLSGLAACV